ncbi:hypothetical protein [Faecalibacter bovis]|uniref:Uncharacterized protein n=1 Tax=Faecalibacter bovis TaxID=2898187 RepID=A0ABX7XAM8_9FLAO|nr:hypothetical protein [Faecalibacter bovis]QTV04953.1 hypothetical protein J9309_09140 [Faecalibacter bovis]
MNNYQAVLGKEITTVDVINFLDSLEGEQTKRENNVSTSYDYELLYKDEGILITISENKISAIKVYFSPTPITQPFRKEFVFGLSYISSENDIKKQFDFPQNLNQEPMRADNIYQYENCTVGFDAMTGEINYAEIK